MLLFIPIVVKLWCTDFEPCSTQVALSVLHPASQFEGEALCKFADRIRELAQHGLTSPKMGNFPLHCLYIYSYRDALTSTLLCRPSWPFAYLHITYNLAKRLQLITEAHNSD